MVYVKIFTDSSEDHLTSKINDYLEHDSDDNLININIATGHKMNRLTPDEYIAIVITRNEPINQRT